MAVLNSSPRTRRRRGCVPVLAVVLQEWLVVCIGKVKARLPGSCSRVIGVST
jgi:hypothetical protein